MIGAGVPNLLGVAVGVGLGVGLENGPEPSAFCAVTATSTLFGSPRITFVPPPAAEMLDALSDLRLANSRPVATRVFR